MSPAFVPREDRTHLARPELVQDATNALAACGDVAVFGSCTVIEDATLPALYKVGRGVSVPRPMVLPAMYTLPDASATTSQPTSLFGPSTLTAHKTKPEGDIFAT